MYSSVVSLINLVMPIATTQTSSLPNGHSKPAKAQLDGPSIHPNGNSVPNGHGLAETEPALLDVEKLLQELSSEEKIKLLSGDDMWHTVPVPRLGIPRVRVGTMTFLAGRPMCDVNERR